MDEVQINRRRRRREEGGRGIRRRGRKRKKEKEKNNGEGGERSEGELCQRCGATEFKILEQLQWVVKENLFNKQN